MWEKTPRNTAHMRQHGKFEYLKSKNRWILKFWRVFLDFLIFSILDGFEVVWFSISTPWLDFLPGAASKSIWAGIFIIFRFFCSYGVHVPTLRQAFLDRKNFPRYGTTKYGYHFSYRIDLRNRGCFWIVTFRALSPAMDAGGKPSTWFPPGRLVELSTRTKYVYLNTFYLIDSFSESISSYKIEK